MLANPQAMSLCRRCVNLRKIALARVFFTEIYYQYATFSSMENEFPPVRQSVLDKPVKYFSSLLVLS